MNKDPNEELLALYREAVAATKKGDLESAADAVLQASAYQGIVNGNMKALELYLVGSGVIQGVQDRSRVASRITNSAVKLIAEQEEAKEAKESEIDYAARLAEVEDE
jgi:hypothetical protein